MKDLTSYIDEYLEYLEIERNCSKLTIRDYRHYLKSFNNWFSENMKDKTIKDLDLATVRKYRVYSPTELMPEYDAQKNYSELL